MAPEIVVRSFVRLTLLIAWFCPLTLGCMSITYRSDFCCNHNYLEFVWKENNLFVVFILVDCMLLNAYTRYVCMCSVPAPTCTGGSKFNTDWRQWEGDEGLHQSEISHKANIAKATKRTQTCNNVWQQSDNKQIAFLFARTYSAEGDVQKSREINIQYLSIA